MILYRFKGLDLMDRVPEELWTEVREIVQEVAIKTIPTEKKCKKAKRLSEEALQIAMKREDSTHGHHQMINTEIRLYSLQPKMEKLYTVSKNKTGR